MLFRGSGRTPTGLSREDPVTIRSSLSDLIQPAPIVPVPLFSPPSAAGGGREVLRNKRAAQRGSFRDGGHTGGRPGVKSGQALEALENKHVDAKVRDPKVGTSVTPGGSERPRSEKLRADCSFPNTIECFKGRHRRGAQFQFCGSPDSFPSMQQNEPFLP